MTLKFINFYIFGVFRFNLRYRQEYSFYPFYVKFTIKDTDNHYKTIKSETINLQNFNDKWLKTQDDDCCTLVISFKKGKIPKSHILDVQALALDNTGGVASNAELIHDSHSKKVRYVAYLWELEDFGCHNCG